jgi:hypothetical protein
MTRLSHHAGPVAKANPPLEPARLRAELRRYVSAYFHASGVLATITIALQVFAVALATLPALRDVFPLATKWVLLALAATPYLRSLADDMKRSADDILRRIEISDGLGIQIRPIELENVRECASTLIERIARRQALDVAPYASRQTTGPRRVVENTRETAWWSARLACELSRWEFVWAFVLAVACLSTLLQVATNQSASTVILTSRDASHAVAEFAAALLVFVFAEGFFRRGLDLANFAKAAQLVFDRADHLLENGDAEAGAPLLIDAVLLTLDYSIARHAAPRLSTIWYGHRRDRLNAAWDRANAVEGPR